MNTITFDKVAGGSNGLRICFPGATRNVEEGFALALNKTGEGCVVLTKEQAKEVAEFIMQELEVNEIRKIHI